MPALHVCMCPVTGKIKVVGRVKAHKVLNGHSCCESSSEMKLAQIKGSN